MQKMNGWAKIKSAAKYADSSERTLRNWLKQGLRHVRMPSGTILIKFAWVDQFLSQFETKTDEIDQITNQILNDF